MLPPIRPALDPFAQRAAIDALEAQRAAYQRYARTVDDHARIVGGGDADAAVAAANTIARGFDELDAGAQTLRPHLDRVQSQGSPSQQDDIQRRVDSLTSDAARAEAAIQNLTSQLDAWRVAYGRQLASVGVTPGSAGGRGGGNDPIGAMVTVGHVGTAQPGIDPAHSDPALSELRAQDTRGYGPRGQAGATHAMPTLLNRLG